MKVKELIEQLEKLDPDHEVGFQPMGSMSGSFVTVQSIGAGFDWQRGKAVMQLSKPVSFYEWYTKLDKKLKDLVRRFCGPEWTEMGFITPPIEVLEARLKKSKRKSDG